MGKAVLERQMEQTLDYLIHKESLKPWLEEQFVSDLCAVDLKFGLRRDTAIMWCVIEEDSLWL